MEDPLKVTQSLAADFNIFIDNLNLAQAKVSQAAPSSSFVSVLNNTQSKKSVTIKKLRNSEVVAGARVAIPLAAIEEVSSRFVNTLYGYFIGKRLAFPLVENYVKNSWVKFGLKRVMLDDDFFLFQFETKEGMDKDEVRNAPIWVKLHHVPIVAYSEIGLSLITTQIGRPIMLDTYTSSMCLRSWGRNEYSRALIEVSAAEELMDEMVIAIPLSDSKGHSLATIDIEYDWKPPRLVEAATSNDDGFTVVKKKKAKAKQPRQIEGIRLTKPKTNIQYRKVEKGNSSQAKTTIDPPLAFVQTKVMKVNSTPAVNVTNSFSALEGADEDTTDWGTKEKWKDVTHVINESDSEVEEMILEDKHGNRMVSEGTSTPEIVGSHDYIFKHWDWTSNGNLCNKGTQIILRWNHYDVDVTVINQTGQVIHTRIWLKVEKKEYIRRRSWCLLGDFNASLFLGDSTTGSSTIDITMRDFKECVKAIEVTDLDRVMANLEFSGSFEGAHAIFYPYRTSDHSPAVLKLPSNVKAKPKPFKFSNILMQHSRFKEVVEGSKELDRVQCDLDHDPSNTDLRVEEAAYVIAYTDALAVKSRTTRNHIDVVTNSDGIMYENDQVPEEFINHYEVFLGQAGTTQPLESHNLFDVTLDEGIALDMVRNVSAQEVKEAMFSMGNDKSHDPDGYTVAFLRKLGIFWGRSKILANLIKESLKVLISPNQSAFVPGRSISDNILLTQELMHNYHLDRGVPRCAFKVDTQKSYDTVYWDFLRLILTCFGFHDRMVAWIIECVTTTSFSLSINGSLHGYFKAKRGLRHGDPLYCSKMELINLCFADDLFLFAHGDTHSARIIMDALEEFKLVSGLILPFEEGRLQLVKSVIESMHVFWALVFILPSRILLEIEQLIRVFIWCNDGMSRGKSKVAWEVVCLPKDEGGLGISLSPLAATVSTRHMYRAGLTTSSKVSEVLQHGVVMWPHELFDFYPNLASITSPTSIGARDCLEWRDNMGNVKSFTVNVVWQALRPRDVKVQWVDVSRVKDWVGLSGLPPSIDLIISDITPGAHRRTTKYVIAKLVVEAAAYFLWQERNARLFKKNKRSEDQVVDCILSSVRLKLFSCRFKKSWDDLELMRKWKISEACFPFL
ncbi:hypothetical protein Tco_0323759 [Tanacetum coccineum]